jgi:hypothetical protein
LGSIKWTEFLDQLFLPFQPWAKLWAYFIPTRCHHVHTSCKAFWTVTEGFLPMSKLVISWTWPPPPQVHTYTLLFSTSFNVWSFVSSLTCIHYLLTDVWQQEGHMWEEGHLEGQGVDWRITLKWNWDGGGGGGMDWINLDQDRER